MAAPKCILEKALGEAEFRRLAPAVQRHYNITGDERRVLRGVMAEMHSATVVKPVLWALRPLNALVPYEGKNVKAVVEHWVAGDGFEWKRDFRFEGKKPVMFESRMRIHNNELVEFINGGLGMRVRPSVTETGALKLSGLGYVIALGPLSIYVPSWLVPFGTVSIEEAPVANDPDSVTVNFSGASALFGQTLGYSGKFSVHKARLA